MTTIALLLYFIPILGLIKVEHETDDMDIYTAIVAIIWPLFILGYVLLTKEQQDKFMDKLL